MTTDQLIEAVARRAASDSDFRRQALTDADAALTAVAADAGATAPAAGTVVFVAVGDEARVSGTDARVVALPESADDAVAMEEADLEQVAGGCQWGCSNLDTSDFPGFPQLPGLPGSREDYYI